MIKQISPGIAEVFDRETVNWDTTKQGDRDSYFNTVRDS